MRQKIGNIGFISYGSEQDLKILIKGLIPQILEHFVDDGELQYPLLGASDPDAHFTITANKVGKDGKLLSAGRLVLEPTAPFNMPGYMKEDFMSHYFMKYTDQQKLIWRYDAHRLLLLHLTEGGERKPMAEADAMIKAAMSKKNDSDSKAKSENLAMRYNPDPSSIMNLGSNIGAYMNPNPIPLNIPSQRGPASPVLVAKQSRTPQADLVLNKGLLAVRVGTLLQSLKDITFNDDRVATRLQSYLTMSMGVSWEWPDSNPATGTYLKPFLSSLFGADLKKGLDIDNGQLLFKERDLSKESEPFRPLITYFQTNCLPSVQDKDTVFFNTLKLRRPGRSDTTMYAGMHNEGSLFTYVTIITDKGVNVFVYGLTKKTKSKKAKK